MAGTRGKRLLLGNLLCTAPCGLENRQPEPTNGYLGPHPEGPGCPSTEQAPG